MNRKNLPDAITAILIEDTNPITFDELCRSLQTEQQFVIELVEHHVLNPQGNSYMEWRFDSHNFKRAKTAVSFYRDLEVNLNGIALALELLDQIDELKRLT